MLKLILILFNLASGTSDIIKLATQFSIELDQNCANVNQALKVLKTLTADCDLSETSNLIGCIRNSVSYLSENLPKLQKCFDHKSFYELSLLLNSLQESQICIIFHTTINLNEYLKSASFKEAHKETVLNKNIEQQFEESCFIQSLKIGTKISKFISSILNPTQIKIIVENWSGFFNDPSTDKSLQFGFNSDDSLETEENIENVGKIHKNFNKDSNRLSENRGIPKQVESGVEGTFWEELYCALKSIVFEIDLVKNFLARYYTKEMIVKYDCSKYTFDLNTLKMKISWLISEKKKTALENLKWAIGYGRNLELDYSFSGFVKKIGNLIKEGVYGAYYYAKSGFEISTDLIKSVYKRLFGGF